MEEVQIDKKMKLSKILIYVFLVVFGCSLFLYLDLNDTTLPYDDVYSIFLIKKSYSEILDITSSDVHPPLYYWCLKTFSLIFGDTLFALRLFSTMAVFATLLLGLFPVRKLFGDKTSVFFVLLLILFPVTQYLAADIRMYSWTMFFVLSCALSAYKVFETGKIHYWVLFLITSVCAAYFHNYGLLSVSGIYIFLFVFLVYKKKKWHYLLICALLFSMAYLPWALQLLKQINSVAQEYWIKPLTVNDFFLHIYYFYSPKEVWLPFTDFSKGQMMLALILLMSIQLILTLKVLASDNLKDKYVSLAIISFLVFLFPVLLGAVISFVCFPILVTRYMTCSFGLFVLSISFILAKVQEYSKWKYLSYCFLFLLLLDGTVRFYSGLKYYNETEKSYELIREFAKSGNQRGDTFIVNDFSYHVMPRLQLIVPDNNYYVLINNQKRHQFAPFIFDSINQGSLFLSNFILVHQEREAVQVDFRKYQSLLEKLSYRVTDSIYASDIYLYRVQRFEK